MHFNIDLSSWQTIGLAIDYSIKLVAIGFVPEGRRPSSSTAWLLAILVLPYVGLPLFLLMGSPYINRRRHRVQQEANDMMAQVHEREPDFPADTITDPELLSIIRMNRALTSLPALSGINHGIHSDYERTIEAMAAAVDKAQKYVHAEIYIFAWDHTTDVFFRALERAVARGVEVRVLFDHVGSWKYPGYRTLGRKLNAIGVSWHLMLPLQPWRWRFRRPDLRNHRKMLIIDGIRGFMGSQNMIDSSYLMRSNRRIGRHWVDVMVELSGPVVSSMNYIFAIDWYTESEELLVIDDNVPAPAIPRQEHDTSANVVQLIPSGPGYHTEPNLRMFNSIIHHAKKRLIMCSPYFIPDESMTEAVTSAAYRGVEVELYVSEQGDQFMVHHAQCSYYQTLLEAGVRIFLYRKPAVLHSKFLLADPDAGDGAIGVIGSSNMDMRSFGLNYEISLMSTRGNIISQLNALSQEYRTQCRELSLTEWKKRSLACRYVDNVMRLTSALQ
ncbi:cardiolipin synthase [Corynebacterium sp. sy017]|uniref:cardiolipin synthase n=1 Tax=unclassified Corynebacterium TaxID=2624378 RepID=UPI0011847072|nr:MULTISPECIES: cardiolipin synthase [unclassified Corynebacterium]MBP3088446.1 cardiolipin synthase [Corynebacterium sp. sy017]TSD91755.1 cardiolipin synthase [Corynebacterium sp. SY003]